MLKTVRILFNCQMQHHIHISSILLYFFANKSCIRAMFVFVSENIIRVAQGFSKIRL